MNKNYSTGMSSSDHAGTDTTCPYYLIIIGSLPQCSLKEKTLVQPWLKLLFEEEERIESKAGHIISSPMSAPLRDNRGVPGVIELCRLVCILQSLLLAGWIKNTEAQRVKEGCYDAFHVSCQDEKIPVETVVDDFSVEEVCAKLILDLNAVLNSVTIMDPLLHVDYINSIESTTELCDQVRVAYPHCIFCAAAGTQDQENTTSAVAGIEVDLDSCWKNHRLPKCGDQPSLEEVLLDDNQYSRFQTQADITATCDGYAALPSTTEVCERQALVGHLCPGNCDGTCFQDIAFPPSCDFAANISASWRVEGASDTLSLANVTDLLLLDVACSELRYKAFGHADDLATITNFSKHAEYFRVIQDTDSDCDRYRDAYPFCVWCDTGLCFDNDTPPTCEPPVTFETSFQNQTRREELEYASTICSYVYNSFYEVEDVFNISATVGKAILSADSVYCELSREVYHLCYWCAPDPEFFQGDKVACYSDDIDVLVPGDFVSLAVPDWKDRIVEGRLPPGSNAGLNCSALFEEWGYLTATIYIHHGWYEHNLLARLCPDNWCPSQPELAQEDYLGTTTTAERKALVWLSRTSAMMSFLGASFILCDILKDATRRSTVFHQLLVGMAIFDICTAFAWVFATAPIDTEVGSHVEGSAGNEASCTAQGFFIQLGFTSVFYNVSLSFYYVLVIAYSWREFQLRRIRPYMHALPIITGVGLALGGIPVYEAMEYGCHIKPLAPPDRMDSLWAELVFIVLPLGLSIIAITAAMLLVYCKVRQQTAATQKWAFGISRASTMQKAVFFQCFFYLLAFYVTWPILFSVYLASIDINGPLGLSMLVAFVAPLQGFNNFLVYMRPRIVAFCTRISERIISQCNASQSQATENVRVSSRDPIVSMGPSAALAFQSKASQGGSLHQESQEDPELPDAQLSTVKESAGTTSSEP